MNPSQQDRNTENLKHTEQIEGDEVGARLSDWLLTPLGRYVAAREQVLFDRIVPDLFGFYALQIGTASLPFLQTSRIQHKFTLSNENPASVQSDPHQLPFPNDQFDVVILPHTLELHAFPHEILREAHRVLRPDGKLLITGFNPYSLFGAKRYFGRDKTPPWTSEFITLSRCKDWLTLLGFEIEGGQMALYNVASQNENTLNRLRKLEDAGDRWWPFLGGIYFLQAIKRVPALRLIKPAWHQKPRRVRVTQTAPVPTPTIAHSEPSKHSSP